MKAFLVFFFACAINFCAGLFAPFILTGCMTDGSSAVSTINATITHTDSGDWIGGLTFTFKELPTEAELITMERQNAKRISSRVFVLPPKK